MGVSEVTAEIAAAIGRAKGRLTAREVYLLYVMQGMPLFRDINRLDLWDKAYGQVARPDDGTETEKLIDALFWLGGDNLYGAYCEQTTRTYYHEVLSPLLGQAGIKLIESPDLVSW
jgi:hypothetical protein